VPASGPAAGRRLFVAVWPDEEARRRLGALQHELGRGRGLRFVGPTRWHVTLRYLGPVREPGPVAQALAACGAAFPGPVECRLGPGTEWFTAVRVLQVPAAGLDALAAAVRAATVSLVAEPPGAPPFNGHLTLARAKGRRLSAAALGEVTHVPFEAAFPVGHVDLVASEPAPEGHRYTTLARVVLGGPPPGSVAGPAGGDRSRGTSAAGEVPRDGAGHGSGGRGLESG
jgi:2'-5' RNA ligase